MMAIKEVVHWTGKETLEDLSTVDVNPLIDLSRAMDEFEEIQGDDKYHVFAINRAIHEGLLSLRDSLEAMWKNFPKEDQNEAE